MKGDTTPVAAMAVSVRGVKSDGEDERRWPINYTALGVGEVYAGLDVCAAGCGRGSHRCSAARLTPDGYLRAVGGGPDSYGGADRARDGSARPPRGPEVWRAAKRDIRECRRADHRCHRPEGGVDSARQSLDYRLDHR